MPPTSIKDSSLIIQAPRQGIAQSPHLGFGNVVNLDLMTVQGVAQLNNILVKKSGTTVTAQINWLVRHPITTAEIYALDAAGTVYKSADSGATWAVLSGTSGTAAHGNGLWIWKNYLFVARDALLDVCGDGTATGIIAANFTLGWKSIDSDVLWHPMMTSKLDGKIYGGAGNYIFTLKEETGKTFAPGDASTYTFTSRALGTIPSAYRVKCLAELGNNLMIGTWQGTNVYDVRIADILTWNGSSSTYGQPIQMNDYGVHAMININNSLIVLAGINGTIFRSDGVNTVVIGQLPIDLSGGKYLEYYPGSIMSYKNKVFFGVGQGGAIAIPDMGVYSLWETGRGSVLNLEHLVSTLNNGSSKPLKPSAILPVSRDTMLLGWRDDTSYGIDLTNNASYAFTPDYSGYFESPLYVVGDLDFLQSYLKLQFRLAKPLASGEGIRLKYRNNMNDSWITIGAYTFATLGAVISHQVPCDIPKCEMVQLRVELLGATTTPQFKSLRLENYFMRGSQAINQK